MIQLYVFENIHLVCFVYVQFDFLYKVGMSDKKPINAGFRRKTKVDLKDHSLPSTDSTDNLPAPENTDTNLMISTTSLVEDDTSCNDLGRVSQIKVEEQKVQTLSAFPTPDELTELLNKILELIKSQDISTLRETFKANFYKVRIVKSSANL